MWKDIFIDNSENIIKILDEFSKNIDDFKKAITDKIHKLLKIFSQLRMLEKKLLKPVKMLNPDFGKINLNYQ